MSTTTDTANRFLMQQVFELMLQDPADKSIIGYLDTVKTTNLENTATMVYATGGRGNVKIGAGFAHTQSASMSVTEAVWNTGILAVQNGTELKTGVTIVNQYDKIYLSNDKYLTKHKATGLASAEINFVYELKADGSKGSVYTQVDGTPSQGEFTYDPTTKEITLNDEDKAELLGGPLFCAYPRETDESSQVVTITGNAVPATVLVTAYGLAVDACSNETYYCQIYGKATVDKNFSFDTSSDGEPAVHNLNLEFVRDCGVDELYTFTVYTEEVVD